MLAFIERNLALWMLFILSMSGLWLYGYNQTSDMKDIALVLVGGLIGFVTNHYIKNQILLTGSRESAEMTRTIIGE